MTGPRVGWYCYISIVRYIWDRNAVYSITLKYKLIKSAALNHPTTKSWVVPSFDVNIHTQVWSMARVSCPLQRGPHPRPRPRCPHHLALAKARVLVDLGWLETDYIVHVVPSIDPQAPGLPWLLPLVQLHHHSKQTNFKSENFPSK